MNVRLLTQESFMNWAENKSGSSRIRGRWLVKYWDEAEEYTIGDKPDVMIFQKAYWKEMMREMSCIKILDICDPDFLEGPEAVGIVEIMNYCDACVTSTEALAIEIRKYTDKPVVCIPDRFDLEEFKHPKFEHAGPVKKAIWYGYAHNAQVLEPVYSLLKQLDIRLLVVSDKAIMEADEWVQYDWASIHTHIKACDIVIMPNHTSRIYKSNNKTVESWLCGMPVAHNYEDLIRLMDPVERDKEAKEKLEYATKEYDIRKSVEQYKQLISELTKLGK